MSHDTTAFTCEETARERIAGWWDLLGREPEYPADTATVVELLRRIEYDVDHDTALAWLTDNVIPPVPREAGRLAWSAVNITTFAAAAEARRRWLPFSTIHGRKFTMVEKLEHVQRHHGAPTFSDLEQFDVLGLLGLLVQTAGDKGSTEILALALKHKLQAGGAL